MQKRRVIRYCFFTYFLCLKTIRDIMKCVFWHSTNYFITHFLRPKMIRDKIYQPWHFLNSLIAHFLCFKMVSDKRKLMWFFGHWKIFCHVQQDSAQQVIHDQEKFTFKQVNHFYLYIWAWQGLNFMVHHFAFITFIFRFIAKI